MLKKKKNLIILRLNKYNVNKVEFSFNELAIAIAPLLLIKLSFEFKTINLKQNKLERYNVDKLELIFKASAIANALASPK